MAKPTSQERRKQVLKQRRAEEQREADREEAEYLYRDARLAHREGDDPAAGRLLRKALVLDPNHQNALGLTADIHYKAGHYAEAVAYARQLHKLNHDPSVLYN